MLSLYGRIRVSENPYSRISYAVVVLVLVNFENISHLFLVFFLLTLIIYLFTGSVKIAPYENTHL